MIKVIFTSTKGGTGKTMTTFQLSGYLSERGYKVLVGDMDPQGNLTRAFLKQRPDKGMFEFLTGQATFEEILVHPYPDIPRLSNLYLLPTTYDLFYFKEDKSNTYSALELKKAMDASGADFDFFLIDTNPSDSLCKTNALCYTDYVLGVLDASLDSIEGFDYLLTNIETIKELVNKKLSVLGVLLNEHDRRTTFSKEMLKVMQTKYKKLLFDTVIPLCVKTAESRAFMLPIIEYDPRCPAAIQYAQLTSEILKRINRRQK